MIDIETLNEAQREAVLDFDHNLLILACAGSGKTRTITSKIAYALEQGIYRPHQILAVTFTNRAAKEMRDRIASLLPDMDISKLEMRTFHSFGAFLLRRFGHEVGLDPNFCIYDDDDSLALLSTLAKVDKKDLRIYQKCISKAKDLGLSPESHGLADISADPKFRAVFTGYEEALEKTGNVDFADLIRIPANLLARPNSEAGEYCKSRFKLILVDEYQDSNKEQFRFLRNLVAEDAKLVVVGDDDQSIYSFRGADVSNILSFSNQFENVREVKLEKNYRSTNEILLPAGALIKNNKSRHSKEIVSADGKTGKKPSVMVSLSGKAEAERIANLIANVRDYDNTAILYRTNAQSQLFEQQLMLKRIPYKVVGALKFYEREEVKDSLALLYLAMNHKDNVSFRRMINKPARGMGEITQNKIMALSEDMHEALNIYKDTAKGAACEGAKLFLSAWDNMERRLDGSENLGDVLAKALEEFKILDHYNSEPDKATRIAKNENLGELVNVLKETGSGRAALVSFLEKLTLDSTTLGEHDSRDERGVTLITMHNTKGLEYDNVFCVGLEQSLIPGRNKDLPSEKEEERRILYVAMTRARKTLYLSYAKNRMMWGHTETSFPSAFLKEIPKEMLGGEVFDIYRDHVNLSASSPSSYVGQSIQYKPRTTVSNKPQWAMNIDIPANKPKVNVIKKSNVRFEVGDKVRSANYGEGVVDNIEDRGTKRILTIQFGSRTAKFVEGIAPLEKL